MLESPVFGLFDTFFELEQYRKNWPMKLGRGNKIFGVGPVFFQSMDRKFLLFRRGSFMGQFFLYRANFEINKKGKRLDFQALAQIDGEEMECSR